ncbi:hypothetical protein EYF80_021141 [Liparis tanakae]|uniref:Uncharacterized protein n=1 Tax=Liparis tanakae TaxID=230148 RepID=A0A4Z2HSE5_9TELE|nr:hypothetical protein EYF80_021141 [Liparis tanakae]
MLRGTTSVTSLSVFLSWFNFRLILNMYSLTASVPGFRPRHTTYLQGPFSVMPNPLACQRRRHSMYSEKPPGPAHTSPKYSSSPSRSLTQAAQTMLQSREVSVMPRMAMLLGFMGIGMSGYSTRQLTLNYKPSSHLFR